MISLYAASQLKSLNYEIRYHKLGKLPEVTINEKLADMKKIVHCFFDETDFCVNDCINISSLVSIIH